MERLILFPGEGERGQTEAIESAHRKDSSGRISERAAKGLIFVLFLFLFIDTVSFQTLLADATAPSYVRRRQMAHGIANASRPLPSAIEVSSARRKIFETGGADKSARFYILKSQLLFV